MQNQNLWVWRSWVRGFVLGDWSVGRVSVLVEVPDVTSLRYIPTHTRKSQSLRSSCMASETLNSALLPFVPLHLLLPPLQLYPVSVVIRSNTVLAITTGAMNMMTHLVIASRRLKAQELRCSV